MPTVPLLSWLRRARGAAVSGQAVSIGLIVTELLINAVKHAFPGDRSGTIRITYSATGPEWRLVVSDDGVGRPTGDEKPAANGLGTSIVQALVQQLDADLDIASSAQGMTVTVTHAA